MLVKSAMRRRSTSAKTALIPPRTIATPESMTIRRLAVKSPNGLVGTARSDLPGRSAADMENNSSIDARNGDRRQPNRQQRRPGDRRFHYIVLRYDDGLRGVADKAVSTVAGNGFRHPDVHSFQSGPFRA